VRISYKLYPNYKEWIWNIKADDILGVRAMMNGTMRMAFATHVVNLTDIGRRIRAKQPLTKIEQEFFKGKDKNRTFRRRNA
jgi:membrane-bound lytic murein transglycosylase MltF